MKKALMLAALLCSVLFAGIGENFERGGIWIGGDGFVYFSNIGDEGGDVLYTVGLEQNFYLRDNFSIGLFQTYASLDEISGFSFGLSSGYTFLSDPDAEKGVAHTISLNVGTTLVSGDFDYTLLNPNYRFAYFVTERIAPYVQVGPSFLIGNKEQSQTDLGINFGLALHFPTKMRVNIPK